MNTIITGAWAGGGAKLNTESKGKLWLLSNTARVRHPHTNLVGFALEEQMLGEGERLPTTPDLHWTQALQILSYLIFRQPVKAEIIVVFLEMRKPEHNSAKITKSYKGWRRT